MLQSQKLKVEEVEEHHHQRKEEEEEEWLSQQQEEGKLKASYQRKRKRDKTL